MRIFIPNYAGIVKGIIDMLKKENEVKWSPISQDCFTRIKEVIIEAPVLFSPDYSRTFYIFYFSSLHTIATVFL